MHRLRPSLLLTICLLALMGVAATAQAQTPLQASFDSVPDAPEVGQVVTFIDTTKNPATSPPYTRAWDLDGDGKFTDSEQATPSKAFDTPGDHEVVLRVRRTGSTTQESIARKTITVKAPGTPTPTPTQTPAETPIPVPTIAAPRINLPPVARIAEQCAPMGPTQLCMAKYAKFGAPKTFDATPSSDAEGPIVRYQWDVDGNGSIDADTGADPHLTWTYRDEQPVTLKLRVTDNDGATADTSLPVTILEAQCQDAMWIGRLYATGACLRRYEIGPGLPLLLPNGKLKSGSGLKGFQYRSKEPVSVNGVTFFPTNNKPILINVRGTGLLQQTEILSGSVTATFPFKGENIVIQTGQLRWPLKNNRLTNVRSLDGAKLNDLRISGAPEYIELPTRGVAKTSVFLKLPDAFGAPTSEKPITLTAGSPKFTLTRAVAADADDAFSFEVPNAALGPIGLDKLKVTYDGDGLWEIEANVHLPVVNASLDLKAGILNGGFNYGGAELNVGSPGIGPLGPVFIQRIKFRIEINPVKSECVPHLGVEDQYFLGVKVGTIDYGVPTYALCGEVGLTGGPSVLGASAISLDAGLSLVTYDGRPSVLRAYGDLKVATIPFADASFELHTDGFMKVAGGFHYGWDGFATVEGNISVGFLGKKFNAEGGVRACLDFVDWCRGVQALISGKGMAVCMIIDYGIDDWRPGFGYKWGDSLPTPYFSGCSLGPYRQKVQASQAGDRNIDLPAGLPGASIVVTGADGPPKITLIGPKGERISTPDDLKPVEAKPFLLMKNPQAKLTQVAIVKPSAGQWKVQVDEGTVTDLKVAHAQPRPEIRAAVTGSGDRRKLNYEVEQRAGQTVTFVERGMSTSGEIGNAARRKGAINFAPAPGKKERRQIVALVEQDGFVTEQPVVTHYQAPKVILPAVQNVETDHTGNNLVVTWAKTSGRHTVNVTLSDGRKIVKNVAGNRFAMNIGSARATVKVRATE